MRRILAFLLLFASAFSIEDKPAINHEPIFQCIPEPRESSESFKERFIRLSEYHLSVFITCDEGRISQVKFLLAALYDEITNSDKKSYRLLIQDAKDSSVCFSVSERCACAVAAFNASEYLFVVYSTEPSAIRVMEKMNEFLLRQFPLFSIPAKRAVFEGMCNQRRSLEVDKFSGFVEILNEVMRDAGDQLRRVERIALKALRGHDLLMPYFLEISRDEKQPSWVQRVISVIPTFEWPSYEVYKRWNGLFTAELFETICRRDFNRGWANQLYPRVVKIEDPFEVFSLAHLPNAIENLIYLLDLCSASAEDSEYQHIEEYKRIVQGLYVKPKKEVWAGRRDLGAFLALLLNNESFFIGCKFVEGETLGLDSRMATIKSKIDPRHFDILHKRKLKLADLSRLTAALKMPDFSMQQFPGKISFNEVCLVYSELLFPAVREMEYFLVAVSIEKILDAQREGKIFEYLEDPGNPIFYCGQIALILGNLKDIFHQEPDFAWVYLSPLVLNSKFKVAGLDFSMCLACTGIMHGSVNCGNPFCDFEGHKYCAKCVEKFVPSQGKKQCPTCRRDWRGRE